MGKTLLTYITTFYKTEKTRFINFKNFKNKLLYFIFKKQKLYYNNVTLDFNTTYCLFLLALTSN